MVDVADEAIEQWLTTMKADHNGGEDFPIEAACADLLGAVQNGRPGPSGVGAPLSDLASGGPTLRDEAVEREGDTPIGKPCVVTLFRIRGRMSGDTCSRPAALGRSGNPPRLTRHEVPAVAPFGEGGLFLGRIQAQS